jgi:hypothetical protein
MSEYAHVARFIRLDPEKRTETFYGRLHLDNVAVYLRMTIPPDKKMRRNGYPTLPEFRAPAPIDGKQTNKELRINAFKEFATMYPTEETLMKAIRDSVYKKTRSSLEEYILEPSLNMDSKKRTRGNQEDGSPVPAKKVKVPTRVQEVPTRAQEVPTRVQEFPTRVQEVPTRVQEVPTRVQEVPTRVQEFPTRVQEVPTPVEEESVDEQKTMVIDIVQVTSTDTILTLLLVLLLIALLIAQGDYEYRAMSDIINNESSGDESSSDSDDSSSSSSDSGDSSSDSGDSGSDSGDSGSDSGDSSSDSGDSSSDSGDSSSDSGDSSSDSDSDSDEDPGAA